MKTKKVPIKRGVRQGDIIYGDIVLVSLNESKLENIMNQLNEFALKIGFNINFGKAKVLSASDRIFKIQGNSIEKTDAYLFYI